MSKTTKEEVYASLMRFVREFGRYPSRQETREYDWLYSQQTCQRLLGVQADLDILEVLYYENPKLCKHCGKIIEFKKRNSNVFCGRSCRATYNNKGKIRPKKARDPDTGVIYKKVWPKIDCAVCGKPVAKHAKKFCSLLCQQQDRHNNKLQQWLDGEDVTKENRYLRRFLIETRGNQCSVCGIEEHNNKAIVFEVEHIDGNSENNKPENVCLICPNCHSQTDTYKGKNRGKGRHSRAQRYRDGKSY